ncbi:MAG: ribose 5-phosphate isomerase B [Actinobacteria bacterium]|nr:ribose 5-phosphate isomerase B [Actinomycetota bacterium]
MRYGFGCDHAGFELKEPLMAELAAAGHEVIDVGTYDAERVDFPVYAHKVAQAVSTGELDMGLLVCGTGLGMALAAGKYPNVRAVSVSESFSARMARRHNDANVLCLGARVLGTGAAVEILQAWLQEDFLGGRYAERLEMMRGGYKGVERNSSRC